MNPTIHIIGLGAGGADSLPPRSRAQCVARIPIFLRTARHPAVTELPDIFDGSIRFDDVYESAATFAEVYETIVQKLIAAADEFGEINYAVPGHPLWGESTVALLLARCREQGIQTKIYGAPSFVDAVLEAVGAAVTQDLAVVDALALAPDAPLAPPILRTDAPLILYQVHDRSAASQAKLALMAAQYPDDFPVTLVRGGVESGVTIEELPLYALDRDEVYDHLTSVYVPALPQTARKPGYDDLVRVMARLRRPGDGCPWDLKQSHATLRRYLIEETFEAVEAIDSGDTDALCEELGDVLLQVVFHAEIARQSDEFDQGDVCAGIVEKMVRRHPHIFADVKADTSEEVLANWTRIKADEKGAVPDSILDGISGALPSLLSALEISRRAVRAGFDWPNMQGVLAKAEEEFAELRAEIESPNPDTARIESELGDVLFTLVNVARQMQIDPETALRRQLTRFGTRFRYMEQAARAQGRAFASLSLDEMEAFWRQAKQEEQK